MKKHRKSVHELIRYPCEHCKFKATNKSGLKKHNISAHEFDNKCDLCPYKGTRYYHVLMHKKRVH